MPSSDPLPVSRSYQGKEIQSQTFGLIRRRSELPLDLIGRGPTGEGRIRTLGVGRGACLQAGREAPQQTPLGIYTYFYPWCLDTGTRIAGEEGSPMSGFKPARGLEPGHGRTL